MKNAYTFSQSIAVGSPDRHIAPMTAAEDTIANHIMQIIHLITHWNDAIDIKLHKNIKYSSDNLWNLTKIYTTRSPLMNYLNKSSNSIPFQILCKLIAFMQCCLYLCPKLPNILYCKIRSNGIINPNKFPLQVMLNLDCNFR